MKYFIIIGMAWQDVAKRILTSVWRKLWPELVSKMDFEEFEPEAVVVEEIVSLGKSMVLDVDEGDMNELIKEHWEELTTTRHSFKYFLNHFSLQMHYIWYNTFFGRYQTTDVQT